MSLETKVKTKNLWRVPKEYLDMKSTIRFSQPALGGQQEAPLFQNLTQA